MPGCFVLRTADDHKDWIWDEIQEGRLRQGWGHSQSSLKVDGSRRDPEQWVSDFLAGARIAWGNDDTTEEQALRRYDILNRMLEIRPGDLIIVPKIPEWRSFALLEAVGEYCFDPDSSTERGDDFHHIIPVKLLSTVPHNTRADVMEVQKALRGYQAAVNHVRSERLQELIARLLDSPPGDNEQDIAALVAGFSEQLIQDLLDRIRRLPPRKFEELLASIFDKQGYEILETNSFDSLGGDADLVASMPLPLVSAIDEFDLKIYVQIKQKMGEDRDDKRGVEQLVQRAAGDRSPILILMSTADGFSDACKRAASDHGVLLLGGRALARALLPFL